MKKILLSTLALMMSFGVMAQRNIDLSVEEFLEPTSITSNTQTGTPVSIVAVIKNNSAVDTVKVGDTLVFQAALRNLQNQVYTATNLLFRLATQEILPGDTQHFRTGFNWGSYLINSQRVNLTLIVWITNQPDLPLDNGTNNALAQEMDYINPNGFGVSVSNVSASEANIYPNPSSGNVTVSLNQAEVGATTKIEVFDLTGKLVRTINSNEVTDISVDLTELNTGIYTMKVTNGTKVTSNKITITK